MRTIFTTEDIAQLVRDVFKGQSEKINLKDEELGKTNKVDLWEYLNVKVYSWKDRVVEKEGKWIGFDDFVASFESLGEAVALVEQVDEEVVASQDIDSATKVCKITFLMQTDKIKNLDFMVAKVRNAYLGMPEIYQNTFGQNLKLYINVGTLMFDDAPFMTDSGECIRATCGFVISYVNDAQSFTDIDISMSLDGDDEYDESSGIFDTWADFNAWQTAPEFRPQDFNGANFIYIRSDETQLDGNGKPQATLYAFSPSLQLFEFGEIVDPYNIPKVQGEPIGDTRYLTMPITKATLQAIFASNPLPTALRPDWTGFCATSLSLAQTLSFFDFNRLLTMKINDLFFRCGAFRMNNKLTTKMGVNIPIYVKLMSNGNTYVYKMMMDNMQKVLTNSDVVISSITLKTWGKIEIPAGLV